MAQLLSLETSTRQDIYGQTDWFWGSNAFSWCPDNNLTYMNGSLLNCITGCHTIKGRLWLLLWAYLEHCRNNWPKKGLKQAFSLCPYNYLNEVNGSHIIFTTKYHSQKKDGDCNLGLCQVIKKCSQRVRNKYFFCFLDYNLSGRECIALKLYRKVPYPSRKFEIDFAGFDWNHLGIMVNKWPPVLFKLLSCVKYLNLIKIQSCVKFEWCIHTFVQGWISVAVSSCPVKAFYSI